MDWTQIVLAIPVWWLNGLLYVLYWLVGHACEFLSILAASVILFGIDPVIQERAVDRPRRYERGKVHTAQPSGQYFTLFVLVVWLAVSASSQFPVSLIGTVLWLVGLVAILAVSEERLNQLWWTKAGILIYSLLVVALKLSLAALQAVNPVSWAGMIGSSADAQVVLAGTRNNLAMIGILIVFVLYPLGFAMTLLNRFFRNPKGLYNLFRESGDVIRRMRTRTE